MRTYRRRSWLAAACVLWLVLGCSSNGSDAVSGAAPRLPEGEAGDVLRRAFAASGGWERWASLRDVSFISTLNILDVRRQVSSESIGWYMAPLHGGARARMDSIGLPSRVQFGIDGKDTWIVSEGRPIVVPAQLALTRFDMVSNLFWFSLPFAVAEQPCTVTDLGLQPSEDGRAWHRLKVIFDQPNPAIPGEWFVLYFDTETWLLDRVHARLTAPILRHELWVGKWLQYRDCDGIKKERQRQFFPANLDGEIIGNMVAEQFVEHVRFDNGYESSHFAKPVTGAEPT